MSKANTDSLVSDLEAAAAAADATPTTPPAKPAAAPAPAPATVDINVRHDEPPKKQRTRNKQSGAKTPRTPSVSARAKKLLGASEVYQIEKIDLGAATYINQYKHENLARFNAIEPFLQRYLVPSYGPGEYRVSALKADGSVAMSQSFHVAALGAPAAAAAPGAAPVAPPPIDVVEQAKKLAELKKILGGDESTALKLFEMQIKSQSAPPPPMPPPAPATPAITLEGIAAMVGAMRPPEPPKQPTLIEQAAQLMPLLQPLFESLKPKNDPLKDTLASLALRQLTEPADQLDTHSLKEALSFAREMGVPVGGGGGLDKLATIIAQVVEGRAAAQPAPSLAGAQPAAADEPEHTQGAVSGDDEQPQIPEGYTECLKQLEQAKGDGARIDLFLRALGHLATVASWKMSVYGILVLARNGEKQETLAKVASILADSRKRGMIGDDAARATYQAFEDNFETAVQRAETLLSAYQSQKAGAPAQEDDDQEPISLAEIVKRQDEAVSSDNSGPPPDRARA